jgi:hypothetical protein
MIAADKRTGDKVVIVQVRLSKQQAERLEKFKLLFNLPKSDMAEVALEDLFKNPQAIIIKKVRKE